MSLVAGALALSLLGAGPASPDEGGEPWFARVEPSLDAGASALAAGDAARALELYRQAKADTANQRAIVEYDVGQATVAQALAAAKAAAPPADAQQAGAPAEPAAPPQLDKELVGDAQAAFARARGLARDPRLKAEASLAGGNLAAVAGDLDQAISQFRQALRDDPSNERAKKNLRRALEAKKQKPPPPKDGDKNDGKNDEDQKDQDQKDQKNQDKKDQDNKDQDKKDQKDQKDQDKNDDKKDQDKKDQEPGQDGDKKDDKKDQDSPAPGSPEEKKQQKKEAARRLLDALRARERPLTPLEMRGAKAVRAKGEKDW